jgi:tetrahydromethanopterin S-methyltransferase subunit B
MERERAKTNVTIVMKVETDIITCITVSLLILRISVSEVRGKIYKLPIILKNLMDKLPIIIKN